jgi:hydroxymethylpyrimidine pyrophosphatase-like HAD family hydrolase
VEAQDMLGVGDGLGDWQFIELCGYGASMGNTSKELKELVRSKGSHGYVGTSVDEHGILDVFEHFGVK